MMDFEGIEKLVLGEDECASRFGSPLYKVTSDSDLVPLLNTPNQCIFIIRVWCQCLLSSAILDS